MFDPVGVQNDIYRRQEMQKAKKEAAETARKNEEMADWLLAYKQVETAVEAETAKHARPPAPKQP